MPFFFKSCNPANDQTFEREVDSAGFHYTILRVGELCELPDE